MPIDHPEGLENPVAKWTVVATMVALVLLIGISIWAAFSIRLDTFARIDEGTDRIHIRGTETKFVGYATARYAGRDVLIEGLPTIEQLQELPLAWRALCVVRDYPRTDWTKADPMLKVHLHSDEMNEACRPFEGLEVDGQLVPEETPTPSLLPAVEDLPGGL